MPRTDHPSPAELAALAYDVPSHRRSAHRRSAHRRSAHRRTTVADHVAHCDACQRAVEAIRYDDADAATLLGTLDHRPPPNAFDRVLCEARRRPRRVAQGGIRHVGRIAAASLLAVAAAAAALPHSPLRRLVTRVRAGTAARRASGRVAPMPATTSDSTQSGAGIAVLPGDSLDVTFLRPARGRLVVRFVDGPQLSLRPRGGSAAFSVGSTRIVVDDSTLGTSFELTVPRRLPHLRVRVDTSVLLTKDAAHVTTRTHVDGETDTYVLDLGATRGACCAARARTP